MKTNLTILAFAAALMAAISGCASLPALDDLDAPESPHDKCERLIALQDYDSAMQCALDALEQSESQSFERAMALCDLANIDIMCSRDSVAWERAVEAESLSRDRGFSETLCQALIHKGRICNYASVSEAENRDDESLIYLEEALKTAMSEDLLQLQIIACYHLSETYVNKNRWNDPIDAELYAKAGNYIDRGEIMAARYGNEFLQSKAPIFRVRYLRQGGRLQEAIDYCQSQLSNSREDNHLLRQQLFDHLAVLYSQTGQNDKALTAHQSFSYEMQKYIRQKADNRLQEMETRYLAAERQRVVERQKNQVLLLILLLLAVVIIAGILALEVRKVRRRNAALKEAARTREEILAFISKDLANPTAAQRNALMQLASESHSLNEDEISRRCDDLVKGTETLEQDLAGYLSELVISRKNAVSAIGLSAREMDVLRLSAEGHSTAEIAEKLFLSPRTVSNHKQNIYSKLSVRSVGEMIAKARELGII